MTQAGKHFRVYIILNIDGKEEFQIVSCRTTTERQTHMFDTSESSK